MSIGNANLDGKLDDVRIYDRALSADEIQRIYNAGAGDKINTSFADRLTNGLVGHWTFDGDVTNANTTSDVSGNGNNGTVNGAVPAIGMLSQALEFDGVSRGVDIGADSAVADIEDTNNAMSISAWIRPADQSENIIVGKHNLPTTSNGRFVFINRNGSSYGDLAFEKSYSDTTLLVSTTQTIELNEWQHVAMTWDASSGDASNVKLFIDGTEVSSYNNQQSGVGSKLSDSSETLNIDGTSSRIFNGDIDDVRIYNRVLSADEVYELYNLGR